MIPILEFENRSLSGPLMKVDEFELNLTKKVRQILKKYEIKHDPNNIIVDDQTADAIFKAGVEMLAEVGVYNIDTQRVIQWTTEEIQEMVTDYKENPRVLTLGKGKDTMTIKPRTGKDTWAPVLWTGAWPIFDQKTFIPFIRAFAQEKDVAGLSMAGGIGVVDGVTSNKGRPSEIYCSVWEAKAQTEALRRAGRPDMARGMIPTATSLGAILASFGPEMLEPWNAMVGIHIMPEQKLDFERLNIAYQLEQMGVVPWTSAMSLVGGLCGGAEGAAVGAIANVLAQLSYAHGSESNLTFNNMNGRIIDRETLWAHSAAYRAIERNLGLVVGTACVDSSQLRSYEEGIIGGVMAAMVITASGAAFNWYGGTTPLTCRIHAEVMRNIAGMDSAKVNEMLQKLSKKIDEIVKKGSEKMLTFGDILLPAVYDLTTLKPKSEYLDAIKSSVESLKECGVPISDSLNLD